MSIFNFEENSGIGTVFSVDTATIIVKVDDIENLRKLQVNHLLAVESSKAGQLLIGIINKITRKISDEEVSSEDGLNIALLTENIVKVTNNDTTSGNTLDIETTGTVTGGDLLSSLSALKEGESYTPKKLEPNQHFTQPPLRYNEARLIKELEENGIGRPSTYAMIMDTIVWLC